MVAKLPFCIYLQYTSKIAENIKGRISGRVKGQRKINYPGGSHFNLVKTKVIPAAATLLFILFFYIFGLLQGSKQKGILDIMMVKHKIFNQYSIINENVLKRKQDDYFLSVNAFLDGKRRTGSSSGEHPSLILPF